MNQAVSTQSFNFFIKKKIWTWCLLIRIDKDWLCLLTDAHRYERDHVARDIARYVPDTHEDIVRCSSIFLPVIHSAPAAGRPRWVRARRRTERLCWPEGQEGDVGQPEWRRHVQRVMKRERSGEELNLKVCTVCSRLLLSRWQLGRTVAISWGVDSQRIWPPCDLW